MAQSNKILSGVLGVFFFAALSLAQAQGTEGSPGTSPTWHSGNRVQEIYSQLNLTDDQKKQLEANKQQHRAIMQSTRQKMKIDRKALQEELMKPQLDMAKINDIHNQIQTLQDKMEDNRLSSILAVRTILTPEQFLKFINLMHQHEEKEEK